MKDKTLIIFIILIIGLGLSILFYELNQVKQLETTSVSPSPTQLKTTPTTAPSAQVAPAQDPEIETQPTISERNDLETLEQELQETIILDEDLSDL